MRFHTTIEVGTEEMGAVVSFFYQDKNLVLDILADDGSIIPLDSLSGPERQNLLEEIEAWQKKVEKYRAGAYAFPAPPVYTNNWDQSSWIKYIDQHGTWLGD
jgi:hypothetical protein